MRIFRIISDGVPVEVHDDIEGSIEDATKKLTTMMKNETVMILVGKNSSAIVRPSSISAINIIDRPTQESVGVKEMQKIPEETGENEEQNIDMICDIENEGE